MKEHGLYIIKKDFFELVRSLGGDCDFFDGEKRPVYCCMKDNIIGGMYWAIPTSDLSHRSNAQIEKYNRYMGMKDDDLRSCYYYIGKTTRESVFKISSCYPIISKYIDHEYTMNGVHVILRRVDATQEIERRLKRVLAFETRRPNYFPQHITDIKNKMIEELKDDADMPIENKKMTLFEEIKNGLQSGLDAYNQGIEMKRTIITTDNSSDTGNN